jgi:large subunit ribosomal protein L10
MLKQEKERVVAEIVERLRTSETLLVADYRGLTHAELDKVRTELLQLGARFAVVKNTLTRRAAEAAGVDTLEEFLSGPTAIAFVTEGDAVGVAKVLSDTARETRRLTLKGAVLQGRVVDGEAVRELATLPPADVLRGQLLGAIVGPVAAIVSIFTAPLRDLVDVLDARIRQLGAQAGSAAAVLAAPDESANDTSATDESAVDAEAGHGPPAEQSTGDEPETQKEES